MPSRILSDWNDSEKVNKVSILAEVVFLRLIMKADDYGRFHASPRLLSPILFPLRDEVGPDDVEASLKELSAVGLVYLYEANSKKLLEIRDFRQRLRQMIQRFNPPSDRQPASGMSDNPRAGCQHEGEEDLVLDVSLDLGVSLDTEGENISVDCKQSTPARPAVHVESLREAWNTKAHQSLPRWKETSATRKRAAQARLRERTIEGPDGWNAVIERINASRFCLGANERGWVASPDFLLRPDTATKVLEGKYDIRQPPTPKEQSAAKSNLSYERTQAKLAELQKGVRTAPPPERIVPKPQAKPIVVG